MRELFNNTDVWGGKVVLQNGRGKILPRIPSSVCTEGGHSTATESSWVREGGQGHHMRQGISFSACIPAGATLPPWGSGTCRAGPELAQRIMLKDRQTDRQAEVHALV